MSPITICDAETGRILRRIQCVEADLENQVQVGEIHLLETAPIEAQWWDNVQGWRSQPAKPSSHCTWDWATKTWSDPRSLNEVKAQQWLGLKRIREQTEYGGFTWDGSSFDSDAQSQSRIQGAAQLATLAILNSQPFSVDWTLADNTVRTLSATDMLAVGTAMGVHIMAAHGVGRGLRAQVEAASTIEAVEAVRWNQP